MFLSQSFVMTFGVILSKFHFSTSFSRQLIELNQAMGFTLSAERPVSRVRGFAAKVCHGQGKQA
jgi:hypothetical protein